MEERRGAVAECKVCYSPFFIPFFLACPTLNSPVSRKCREFALNVRALTRTAACCRGLGSRLIQFFTS